MAKSAKRAKKAGARSARTGRSARSTTSTRKTAKRAKSTRAARTTGRTTRAGGARGTKRKAARKGGARATKRSAGRRPNAAFMAPVTPSPALAEIVGDEPIPRTEVTKRLWAYIKKHDLQDVKNRRTIKADAALKPIFGGKSSVNMFEMTRLVGRHLD